MLLLAMAAAGAPTLDINYIVISSDRDHASCPGEPAPPMTVFYDLRAPNGCFSLVSSSDSYFMASVAGAGISLKFYGDDVCQTQTGAAPDLPFGACLQPANFTKGKASQSHFSVDAAQYLPEPQEGRVLARHYPEPHCTGIPNSLTLYNTQCGSFFGDVEIDCGEGVNEAYTAFKYLHYSSRNGSCSGAATPLFSATLGSCSTVGVQHLDNPNIEPVWCGGPCRRWKTMRSIHPRCDAPDSGTPYAVDLDASLGPKCSTDSLHLGVSQCCFEPLGYDGGVPFGTSCKKACAAHGRFGDDAEWCQISNGGEYGNWCARFRPGATRDTALLSPLTADLRVMAASADRSATSVECGDAIIIMCSSAMWEITQEGDPTLPLDRLSARKCTGRGRPLS